MKNENWLKVKIVKGYVRFEGSYGGVKTILEGSEFNKMVAIFIKLMTSKSKKLPENFERRFIICAIETYRKLYGYKVAKKILVEMESKTISSPDERKIALFCDGMHVLMQKYLSKKNFNIKDIFGTEKV